MKRTKVQMKSVTIRLPDDGVYEDVVEYVAKHRRLGQLHRLTIGKLVSAAMHAYLKDHPLDDRPTARRKT